VGVAAAEAEKVPLGEALGEDVSIVGTAREAEIVPLLRAALKLQ
jgi:hypothetical protein